MFPHGSAEAALKLSALILCVRFGDQGRDVVVSQISFCRIRRRIFWRWRAGHSATADDAEFIDQRARDLRVVPSTLLPFETLESMCIGTVAQLLSGVAG